MFMIAANLNCDGGYSLLHRIVPVDLLQQLISKLRIIIVNFFVRCDVTGRSESGLGSPYSHSLNSFTMSDSEASSHSGDSTTS